MEGVFATGTSDTGIKFVFCSVVDLANVMKFPAVARATFDECTISVVNKTTGPVDFFGARMVEPKESIRD